jgi:ATP-dependent DNA helicase
MDPTPVFLTTYEMIIRDRAQLTPFEWRYIIVDEGKLYLSLSLPAVNFIKP